METSHKTKKGGFGSSIGFILSAAASAVGVGNIWRFPTLAAKNGGGLFLLVYFILVLTFGFAMLTTDIVIGRKTGQNALNAYSSINKKWKFLGILTFIVPVIIMTYYAVIGAWVTKYMMVYLTSDGKQATGATYFTDFITSKEGPIVFTLIFMALTSLIVFAGVEKGIEKFSKIVMPILLVMILGISLFSLTLSHTNADGVTRTGLQGLAVYVVPNFDGLTPGKFLGVLLDAMMQLFYSLSIAMGIMITYGSYVPKDVDLSGAVSKVEIFDTAVAFLAGLMIVPAVYVFSGTEGMAEGAGLMFVSLPKVFAAMGAAGKWIGLIFFIMVAFAALTSSVSVMEAVVANCMELFKASRKKVSIISFFIYVIASVIICLGYNDFYFEVKLPTGSTGQLLDVMDYISNSVLMPIVALLSSIFVGWVIGPKWITDELESNGKPYRRKKLYTVIIKYVAPVVMFVIFLKAVGLIQIK